MISELNGWKQQFSTATIVMEIYSLIEIVAVKDNDMPYYASDTMSFKYNLRVMKELCLLHLGCSFQSIVYHHQHRAQIGVLCDGTRQSCTIHSLCYTLSIVTATGIIPTANCCFQLRVDSDNKFSFSFLLDVARCKHKKKIGKIK